MLAYTYRFHGYHSLDTVYKKGKTIRGPYTMVRYCRNPKRTNFRAAVVVSKKVQKSAVGRNRMRRRLYEIIRQQISPGIGYDIVVTVFDEVVATLPAGKLEQALVKQLSAIPDHPGPHAIVEESKGN
jgi:ribonuclease P protein component